MIDGCDDVFGLGKTISAALARPDVAPKALTGLLARMLATDPSMQPTSPEVVTAARSIRNAIGSIDEVDVDHLLAPLACEVDDEGPEIVIEQPTVESDDDEPILLDRPSVTFQTVIVDLDACL